MKKRILKTGMVCVICMMLAACGTADKNAEPTAAPVATQAVEPTAEPTATEAPTETPTPEPTATVTLLINDLGHIMHMDYKLELNVEDIGIFGIKYKIYDVTDEEVRLEIEDALSGIAFGNKQCRKMRKKIKLCGLILYFCKYA